MDVKPVRNKNDHKKALKRIGQLMDAKKNTPEFDELEVLSILVEKYEDEHFPISSPDPIEVIKFYMEQNGLTNKDLAKVIGYKGRVSEILKKKRPLSINMIRVLVKEFSIPADALIQKYSLDV